MEERSVLNLLKVSKTEIPLPTVSLVRVALTHSFSARDVNSYSLWEKHPDKTYQNSRAGSYSLEEKPHTRVRPLLE